MEPIKILIVEDESLVAMDISDMLTRLHYEVLPNALSYNGAIEIIDKQKPDLALVDINLGGEKSGIELAETLKNRYKVPFIFITSHSDKKTVAQAASLKPNGYLVKPFEQEDLFTSIEMAIASLPILNIPANEEATGNKLLTDCLFVKTDRNYVKVKIEDILWLQSDHNYIYIITEKGKNIVRSNFKELLSNLPNDLFVQVHKSYMVNLRCIDAVSHTEVLVGGTEIPLSRSFKEELMSRITRIA